MKIILGIDPSLNNVGYAVINYDEITDCIIDINYGIYDINKKDTEENKLNSIFIITKEIIKAFNVSEVSIEKAYHNPKTAKGGFLVREAIGALKVSIVQESKPIVYFTPQRVKKDIAGHGKASKLEVAQSISQILNISKYIIPKKNNQLVEYTPTEIVNKKLDHITDALAIAYCRVLEIKEGI